MPRAATLLIAAALLLSGCRSNPENLARFEYARLCMGVRTTVTLYAPGPDQAQAAASAAFDRIADLDQCMSDYRPTSELMRLCAAPAATWVPVSEDLFTILQECERVSRDSDGAFDVTVGPAVALWRRAKATGTLPSAIEVRKARMLINWERVGLRDADHAVRLALPGMRLDLGAIAKGYAAQRAVDTLKSRGVPRCLVALSGDIVAGNPPPGQPGWRVTVSGEQSGKPLGTLLLSNAAVSTAGDTEQFVEIEGKRYSHILDPRTGLGITDRRCVTVVALRGDWSDALDTPACILGPEASKPFLAHYPNVAAIFDEAIDSPASTRRTIIDPEHLLRWVTPVSDLTSDLP